jgi:hypothetical protein
LLKIMVRDGIYELQAFEEEDDDALWSFRTKKGDLRSCQRLMDAIRVLFGRR